MGKDELYLNLEKFGFSKMESIIYVEGIPKGTSVTEGGFVKLIVKGDGAYRYTTGFGTQKVVVKAIWQDKIK